MTQIYRISQKIIGLGQIWAKKCPKSGQNRAYSELKIIFLISFFWLSQTVLEGYKWPKFTEFLKKIWSGPNLGIKTPQKWPK